MMDWLAQARVYSPAAVLGAWSALTFLGVHGDKLDGFLLALTAMAVVGAERERRRQRRNAHPDLYPERRR